MTAPLEIGNRQARHLWLAVNGLAASPVGPVDVMRIIRDLGFVQIDTVRNVTRAHHHILWSRHASYREDMLWPRLETRDLFEHFTHDASLIPMEILPMWGLQFRRLGDRAARAAWYQSGLGKQEIARIHHRIAQEGALSTHAFDTKAERREMWARPPHKRALEQMWYAGALATSHRRNFVKYYDLGERVFPTDPLQGAPEPEAQDWLCDQALGRLGMASIGEVQRFWGAMSAADARDWLTRRAPVPLRVQAADGSWQNAWGAADIEARLECLPDLPKRMRLLNPFDPAIRDRSRVERLFGFTYRNEMFVPKQKRRWGYYVYPLLEEDRFVGRIELCADRPAGWMKVTGFWPEPGVRWGAGRRARLDAELHRLSGLAEVSEILWEVPEPG